MTLLPGSLRAALVAAGLVMAPLAQANLVLNGSFENTTATQTDYFIGKVANWGNSNIGEAIVLPSWYTLGYLFPGVGVAGALPQSSPDGGNFVFSDGDFMNSAITQTLTGLTPGATYAISFWEGLIEDTEIFTTPGPVSGHWLVSLGSNSANGALMTGNGITQTFTNWQQETLYLKANSSTEVLSFLSVGAGDPPLVLLDGVNVTELPEPATLGLTLAAVLAGGTVYRRRRWQAAGA